MIITGSNMEREMVKMICGGIKIFLFRQAIWYARPDLIFLEDFIKEENTKRNEKTSNRVGTPKGVIGPMYNIKSVHVYTAGKKQNMHIYSMNIMYSISEEKSYSQTDCYVHYKTSVITESLHYKVITL